MEVNISHRTRQEIVSTTDLAHSNLFNRAISELLLLMKMVLAESDNIILPFHFSLQ